MTGAKPRTPGLGSAVRRLVQDAVDRDVITHHFQPVWDLADGQLMGFEALARFPDDVPPDLVFREAKQMGLGRSFDVLSARCALTEARSLPGFLFINLDPNHLQRTEWPKSPGLRPFIQRDRHRDAIILEITETPEQDRNEAVDGVERMRRLGVRLALDDAGADASDLDRLGWLHPAFVKLDRSLVMEGLGCKPDNLQAWIQVSRRLGATLIAEGVEDERDGEALKAMSVDWVQGYAFGRPEPLAAWADRMPDLAADGRLATALKVFAPPGLEPWSPPSPMLTIGELGDLFFENLPFPVCVLGPEGRIANLNNTAEVRWGHTLADVLGEPLESLGLRRGDEPESFWAMGSDGTWQPTRVWSVVIESRARSYEVLVGALTSPRPASGGQSR